MVCSVTYFQIDLMPPLDFVIFKFSCFRKMYAIFSFFFFPLCISISDTLQWI